jgi:ankyrin repeat protein
LERGPYFVNQGLEKSILPNAVSEGIPEIVDLLLKHGADPEGTTDTDSRNQNALSIALSGHDYQCVRVLLDHGVEPDDWTKVLANLVPKTPQLPDEEQALMSCMQLMLDKCKDHNAASKLLIKVAHGSFSLDIGKFLLQNGADVNAAFRGSSTALCNCMKKKQLIRS